MEEFVKEPQEDCIFCMKASGRCRGLNRLYCAMELRECPFYKSKNEYDTEGKSLKGVKNGIYRH